MRPIRAVAVLPTLFTLGNLVCGFFAIVVLARIEKPIGIEAMPTPKIDSARELIDMIGSSDPTHNLMLSGALILLAMFFDAVDGQVARLTRRTSDFGAQLDSLCDLVSFGLAPAILLVKMCPQFTSLHSEAVWTIAALFVCCAALRLARFNVESDDNDDHMSFAGLPTPAAAAAIASFAILSYTLRNEENIAAARQVSRLRLVDAAAPAVLRGGDRDPDGLADSVSASAHAVPPRPAQLRPHRGDRVRARGDFDRPRLRGAAVVRVVRADTAGAVRVGSCPQSPRARRTAVLE